MVVLLGVGYTMVENEKVEQCYLRQFFSMLDDITRHEITIKTIYSPLKIGAAHYCRLTCFLIIFL